MTIIFYFYIFDKECEIYLKGLTNLYFLYINENSYLNSIAKELTINGQIVFHLGLNPEDISENKNKNIQKEAGSIFEILCCGAIQKKFTLKHLLFIANEENGNMDCELFPKKYEKKECQKNLSELLKEFPENQILSDHVKLIKGYIWNNLEKNAIDTLNNLVYNYFYSS